MAMRYYSSAADAQITKRNGAILGGASILSNAANDMNIKIYDVNVAIIHQP